MKGDLAMTSYENCRCYVDHLMTEHRRLHRLLRLARAALVGSGGPDRDASGTDMVKVLRQVRSELARHFAQEEGGGCLDEVVSHCPSLSHDAQRIMGEHPPLLEGVDRLIAEALDCDQSVERRLAVERGFDELCRQLETHECAENNLLRKGFGVNFNGGETGQPTLTHDV